MRMIYLCKVTYLRLAHSYFLNRKARLYIYVGPKGDQQTLDHFMIRSKLWKSITNCRAYNTIDIASDHRLVNAYFRLSLRANKQVSNVRCILNKQVKHASEKVLGNKPNNKHASWVSPETKELFNTCNKAAKRFKRIRQIHEDQWQLLQGQVSAAFDLDQQVHLDSYLAPLDE